jgi:hypothetical protein
MKFIKTLLKMKIGEIENFTEENIKKIQEKYPELKIWYIEEEDYFKIVRIFDKNDKPVLATDFNNLEI